MASKMDLEVLPFPVCDCCRQDYDDGKRNPLLLPCGHVYCKTCLNKMEEDGDQVCPKSRMRACKSTDWSDTDIADLTVVYSMIPSDRGITPTGRAVAPAPDGLRSPRGSIPRTVAPTVDGRAVAAGVSSAAQGMGAMKLGSNESFPVCELCLEHYNKSNKRPLLLGCGHSFCKSCLLVIGDEKKQCPCCRDSWDPRTLDKLPVVLSLIHPSNADRVISDTPRSALLRNADALYDEPRAKPVLTQTQTRAKTQIFVRDINNKTHTIHMYLDDTVDSLRQQVTTIVGVGPQHQTLQYEGRVLEDGRTLLSYKVRTNSTINMVGRLRGGA